MSIGSFFTSVEHDVAAVFTKAGAAVATVNAKLTTIEQAAGIVLGFAAVAEPELAAAGSAGAAVAAAIPVAQAALTALKANAPKIEADVSGFLTELGAVSDQVMALLAQLGPFITAMANDAKTALAQAKAVAAAT